MFSRKRKAKVAERADAVAERGAEEGGDLREQLDDLTQALAEARDAITRASASAGRKVAGVTTETARQAADATKDAARSATGAGRQAAEASRKAADASRKAGRRRAKAARQAADRLSESDLGDVTRRAAGKLFPEKAKERRKAQRKRRRRLVVRGAGLAGLGLAIGWLTAPKRGREARQALKQQAAKASEKGWEKVSERGGDPGPAGPAGQSTADVTPIHDGVGTGSQPRPTPRD